MFLFLLSNQKINRLFLYFSCFFVTIIFLDILNFDYPSSSLDGSWHYYMTYAFLNKLSFTKDIIFTYGPLGFLHAKTYIPGIFYQHILLSLCIIIPYSNSLYEYLSDKNIKLIVIPLLMLFFLNKEVAFFIFYLILYENLKRKEKINIKDYVNLIPIYLFPFIKTVFLIPSAILFLFFIFNKNKSKLLYFTISSIFFTCCFWLIGGQEILSLFNYLFNFLNIMNGYSENLSIFGNKYEIIIALILIILILLNLHIHKLSLFDFIFYLLFFFLLFKVGFVRHDGHAVKFFGYVLFFSLILFNLKKKINLILISFLFFTYIFSLNFHNLNSFYLDRVKNIGHTFSSLIDIGFNFKNYIDDNDQKYLKSKNKIIEHFDFSSYSNKVVDIYNYNQGIVIANKTIPGFRPQFQSFNASNSFLIKKNLNHLKNNPPEYIFFKLQHIDNHYPLADDSLSLIEIQKRYKLIDYRNDYLIFEKSEISNVKNEISILKVDISPTFLGKFVKFIFKIPKIEITLVLDNGNEYKKHIGSANLKNGIIISPFIENNFQLIYLLSDVDLLEENKVVHYELNSFLFKYLWKINAETIEKTSINQNTKYLDFISKNSIIFKNIEIRNLKKIKCTYSIDENFYSKNNNYLFLRGWAFPEIDINTDSPIILFEKNNNEKIYTFLNINQRLDVANYFQNKNLENSGFDISMQSNKINKNYFMGFEYDGLVYICE